MKIFLIIALFYFAPFPLTAETGLPNDCVPVYEINAQWQTIRIRAHENDFLDCDISAATYSELVHQAMTDPRSQSILLESVFLGRMIDYPWLSRQLAEQASQHPGWDTDKGQTTSGHINAFVTEILSSGEILEQLQRPFIAHGYRVTGVSAEKVLVDRMERENWPGIETGAYVPYDAMVHLRLQQLHHH